MKPGWIALGLVMSVPLYARGQDAPPAVVVDADSPVPLRWVDRPLSLPEGTFEVFAGLDLYRLYYEGYEADPGDAALGVHAGFAYGVGDILEIGTLALPLQLSPEADYRNPDIYALLRFLRGPIEIGASARFELPIAICGYDPCETDPALGFSVPVLIRAAGMVRIDTGPVLDLYFGDDDTYPVFAIPTTVGLQLDDRTRVGLTTGLILYDLDADLLTIPLGVAAGYSFGGQGKPLVEPWVLFRWPALLTPGGDDAVHGDIWQLSFLANVYFDLGT